MYVIIIMIIYKFPAIKESIKTDLLNIEYYKNKPSKLIKYGFNHIEDDLDLISLTTNDHYKSGLNFDFTRNDKKSIKNVGIDTFGKLFNTTYAEFWEIITVFNILKTNNNVYTSHADILNDILDNYGKMANKLNKITINNSKTYDVILYKFSEPDVHENVSVHLLLTELSNFMNTQNKGGSMILQLFSLQTDIIVNIMYFIASYYENVYLFRPDIVSNLSTSCYLVCSSLKQTVKLNNVKIPSDMFVHKLFKRPINIQSDFTTIIQCFNSEIVPQKINTFYEIKKYLDSKVYEGVTYTEMLQHQDKNTDIWIKKYVTDITKLSELLSKNLEQTSKKCDYVTKLNDLFI